MGIPTPAGVAANGIWTDGNGVTWQDQAANGEPGISDPLLDIGGGAAPGPATAALSNMPAGVDQLLTDLQASLNGTLTPQEQAQLNAAGANGGGSGQASSGFSGWWIVAAGLLLLVAVRMSEN